MPLPSKVTDMRFTASLAGRSHATGAIVAAFSAVPAQQQLLQLKLNELSSLADVAAEVTSHLIHGSLNDETWLASARLPDAIFNGQSSLRAVSATGAL